MGRGVDLLVKMRQHLLNLACSRNANRRAPTWQESSDAGCDAEFQGVLDEIQSHCVTEVVP